MTNEYQQHNLPGSAGAQGPGARATVYNYGVDGPAFWVQPYQPTPVADLTRLRRLREQPSRLLVARRKVIPFTGRDRLLTDLAEWRQDADVPRAAWLIHAAGGQGKTRLADEVAAEATAAGWAVGYVRHRSESPVSGGEFDAAAQVPLLLVVDYAERWPHTDLVRFLRQYVPARRGPVRLLLLARSTAWWPMIEDEFDALDTDTRALALPALGESERERRELFDQACARYAEIFDIDAEVFSPPGSLADPAFGLVLALHMAALATVDARAHGQRAPAGPSDLSAYLLNRERSYWAKTYGEDRLTVASRAVFVAALAGPLTNQAGAALLTAVGLPAAEGMPAQKILDEHQRCYPAAKPGTVLEPLYPDRLAEDFIALTLPGHERDHPTDAWAADLLTAAPDKPGDRHIGALVARDEHHQPPTYISRTLTFLAAAATRWPHVATHLLALLHTVPALAVDAGGAALAAVTPLTDAELADTISKHLPDRHVDLDQAAALLTEHLTHQRLPAVTAPAERARLLNRLGYRLFNASRHADALTAAQESLDLYRHLAAANPTAFEANLARALNNLGVLLSNLGWHDEALTPTHEAVDLYRQLAAANPAAFDPHLAGALAMHARVRAAGRVELLEALAAARESVAMFQNLARRLPEAFTPLLLTAANILARVLDALGRGAEADEVRRRFADGGGSAG